MASNLVRRYKIRAGQKMNGDGYIYHVCVVD